MEIIKCVLLWSLLQYLKIQYVLDPVQGEKNLCRNIMKIIWGVKNTLKLWLDIQETKIWPHLHLVPACNGTILFLAASYVLSKDEKFVFLSIIQDQKTPINYVFQLAKGWY